MRVVTAAHGNDAAMRYKFRVRIQEKNGRYGFLWLKRGMLYRTVLERYHMSWEDYWPNEWSPNKEEVIKQANAILDRIESTPKGEYV
jgi:hypothetical protein